MSQQQLIIYTDGAARGNPGPGGYGIVMQWGQTVKEFSQGYRLTTNNRMELMAVVVALQSLTREGLDVVIYSDSSYVVNSVEKGWVFGWVKKGFKDKKNVDLWQQYLKYHNKHRIKFVWVKGHADNPMNNRCDQLATAAADSGKWLVDAGYESGN
ncbi:MAG: ribonuclease HI [Bacteroidetes bacterium]|nr:ribonuclease HI [Bacteroidota bacterium]